MAWQNPQSVTAAAERTGLHAGGRKMRCPNKSAHAHGDHNPSAWIARGDGSWKCYACGVWGTADDLLRGTWRSGDGPRSRSLVRGDRPAIRLPSEYAEAPEVYHFFWEACNKTEADKWLSVQWGVENTVHARGGAGSAWRRTAQNFPQKRLQRAGLVNSSGRFVFSHAAVVFPAFVGGEIVGLRARVKPGDDGKPGAKELALCGDLAPVPFFVDAVRDRDGEPLHLCEGIKDALALLDVGLCALALPGPSCWGRLRDDWLPFFSLFPKVVVCFDGDSAGQQYSREVGRDLAEYGIRTSVKHLPDGMDAFEVVEEIRRAS